MPNTEDDVWRMIWEKKLNTIVMLTKCTEAGRVSYQIVFICLYLVLTDLKKEAESF